MEKRIEEIKEYFCGLEIQYDELKIKIKYPSDEWHILTDKQGLVKITKSKETNMIIYRVNLTTMTADELFDFIESTISFNKDVERKKEILLKKYQELSEIVATHTPEELESLTWVLKPIRKNKTKKNTNKVEELANEKTINADIETVNENTNASHSLNETILTSDEVDNLTL